MSPFAWNILLALAWVAVSGDLSGSNLLAGFVFGYVILGISLRSIPAVRAYLRRVPNLIRFLVYFIGEMIRANIKVAWDVVTPTDYMRPAVIAYPLTASNDIEITILANLISLTPGSLALDVSSDRKTLYVHLMYFDDEASALAELRDFEARVLTVLR